jgi:hypothetical protein
MRIALPDPPYSADALEPYLTVVAEALFVPEMYKRDICKS